MNWRNTVKLGRFISWLGFKSCGCVWHLKSYWAYCSGQQLRKVWVVFWSIKTKICSELLGEEFCFNFRYHFVFSNRCKGEFAKDLTYALIKWPESFATKYSEKIIKVIFEICDDSGIAISEVKTKLCVQWRGYSKIFNVLDFSHISLWQTTWRTMMMEFGLLYRPLDISFNLNLKNLSVLRGSFRRINGWKTNSTPGKESKELIKTS